MKVCDLILALEEFQGKLLEHGTLWGDSLDSIIPDYPVRDERKLEEQTRWLSRKVGALRPFIERFDDEWLMVHPATGVRWDALTSSVGLADVAQIKGPSIRTTTQKLDQILGRLHTLDPNDNIPEDRKKPIGSGLDPEHLMLAYIDHLHPFIARGCAQLFRDGHYPQAVEEAAKAVFQYIRDATGLTIDGTPLAQTAFSVSKPILAFNDLADQTKKDEQVGFMEMLSGFAKGVRNPLAHTHGKTEETQKAFEYLTLASLFCRRIDDATPRISKP